MEIQLDSMIVDARPTKDLFIYMLVRDIPLLRAVIDLIDNSVDGARRLRPDDEYDGLWVRIDMDGEHFRVADNCGGIPVDLARRYAFRFGRPGEMQATPRSIGQFGVGMKRAFFKLGGQFKVESTTETSRFVVEENVNEWKEREDWQFEFRELEEELDPVPLDECGTRVTVTSLHKSVSESFRLENFRTRLIRELEAAHQLSTGKGLAISLNGIPLCVRPLEILHSEELKPAHREIVYREPSPSPVTVDLYAGISKSEPSDAGWYIFCNGRMLLESDKSFTTGWGEGDGTTIPRYHNQFARFRGYSFFDSDDAGVLPWNTTKTGVDGDSPVYRAVRLEMIDMMRPVIDFLNLLDAEKDEKETDETPLETTVNMAKPAKLSEVEAANRFVAPKPKRKSRPPHTGRILYYKPKDEIDRIKKALKVRSQREVGEKTFEYFFRMECED